MKFELISAEFKDLPIIKRDMQEAFQKGAVAEYGLIDEEILPEKDIDSSLAKPGAVVYKAMADGELAGGAIVVIDEESGRNYLDFLYVKCGSQSKGIGLLIWKNLEKLYPQTKVWETCTPYFEKRNIHFYINCCGFQAVEFFNPHHKDASLPEDMIGGDYFFRFEKNMQNIR